MNKNMTSESYQKFGEYGRRMAAQGMRAGERKGISADGQEVVIKITIPADATVDSEPQEEGPIRKKMREFGMLDGE